MIKLKQIWFFQTRNFETEPGGVYYAVGKLYKNQKEAQLDFNNLNKQYSVLRLVEEWVHPNLFNDIFQKET